MNGWINKTNPFQYSCLGNPLDRGDWWVTLHGVQKSWTQLSDETNNTDQKKKKKQTKTKQTKKNVCYSQKILPRPAKMSSVWGGFSGLSVSTEVSALWLWSCHCCMVLDRRAYILSVHPRKDMEVHLWWCDDKDPIHPYSSDAVSLDHQNPASVGLEDSHSK